MPDTKHKTHGRTQKSGDSERRPLNEEISPDASTDEEVLNPKQFSRWSLVVWIAGFSVLAWFAFYDLVTALLFR